MSQRYPPLHGHTLIKECTLFYLLVYRFTRAMPMLLPIDNFGFQVVTSFIRFFYPASKSTKAIKRPHSIGAIVSRLFLLFLPHCTSVYPKKSSSLKKFINFTI